MKLRPAWAAAGKTEWQKKKLYEANRLCMMNSNY
jgi:hypothetical protein